MAKELHLESYFALKKTTNRSSYLNWRRATFMWHNTLQATGKSLEETVALGCLYGERQIFRSDELERIKQQPSSGI